MKSKAAQTQALRTKVLTQSMGQVGSIECYTPLVIVSGTRQVPLKNQSQWVEPYYWVLDLFGLEVMRIVQRLFQ